MHKLIAFDPGKTTGIAEIEITDDGVLNGFKTHHLLYGEELNKFLEDSILYQQKVIVESFLLRPGMVAADTTPLKVIGIIEYFNAFGKEPIAFQKPADVKGLWSDDKLKAIGFWTRNKHERDASRHLASFIQKKKLYDFSNLLKENIDNDN